MERQMYCRERLNSGKDQQLKYIFVLRLFIVAKK